jgi:hypothetical protein
MARLSAALSAVVKKVGAIAERLIPLHEFAALVLDAYSCDP